MGTSNLRDRLTSIRKRKGLTQRELASAAGVSISLIRRLEQGEHDNPRMETLHRLAQGLRVPTSDLIVRPDADDAPQGTKDQWKPVCDALAGKSAGDEFDEDPTHEGVGDAVNAAMPLFARDRFGELGALLPPLLRDADALGSDGRQVRSRLLHLTGWLLTQTRQFDAADSALRRALADSTDRMDSAATVNTMCWLLIRQGKLAETLELASKWADEIEPRMSRATMGELSAWGWLLIRLSTAAVRNNEPSSADDTLALARSAAVLMGREYAPPADFLRTFGPVTVAMKRAENAMIEDRPDRVLALSERIPAGGLRPTSNNNNRHRLDVAKANLKLRKRSEAFEILQEVRNTSPEWLVNQRLARDILGDVIVKRRSLTPEMREMAGFLHLEH